MVGPAAPFRTFILGSLLSLGAADSALAACAPDAHEPDDACLAASSVLHGAESQSGNFCDDGDDWIAFNACASRTYTIETGHLGAAADTVVEVYLPDCTTLFASNDDGAGGRASRVVFTAPLDGIYRIRVLQADGTSGDDRTYDVSMTGDTSACSTWVMRFFTQAEEHAVAAAQLSTGSFALLGSSDSEFKGRLQFFAMKLFPDGTPEWLHGLGGLQDSDPHALVETADGGIVFVGDIRDGSGPADGVAAKLDVDGNFLWKRTLDAGGDDHLLAAGALADGGVVLAGVTDAASGGDDDAWVVRLDAAGSVVWRRRYDGDGSDRARSIQQTPDGGFIVAGASNSFPPGRDRAFVLKLDGSGQIVWQRVYGPRDLAAEARSVRPTRDGGYIVVGAEGPSPPVPGNLWSLLVFRVDGSGSLSWVKTFDTSTAAEAADSVWETADGGYFIGTEETSAAGIAVAGILRVNASGIPLWHRQYQRLSSAAAIEQTVDGGFIAAGKDFVVLRGNGSGDINCALFTETPATMSASFLINTAAGSHLHNVSNSSQDLTFDLGFAALNQDFPCPSCGSRDYTGMLRLDKIPFTLLYWDDGGPGKAYDILRGSLDTLIASGGDFTQAVNAFPEACVVDDQYGAYCQDLPDPTAGSGFFYLVRAVAAGCPVNSTYDEPFSNGVAPRDAEIAAAASACP